MQAPAPVSAVLLVAMLWATGCGPAGFGHASPTASLTSTPDVAVVRYRTTIDADMRSLSRSYDRPPCASRDLCLRYLMLVKAATEALIADLSAVPPPPSLRLIAEKVESAADRFLDQLNAAISTAQRPDGNYQGAANGLNPHDVDFAVAELDCWPALPVNPGSEGDYTCG